MYVDAIMTGIRFHSSQPPNPDNGDCYYDERTGCNYVFDGLTWVVFSSSNDFSVGIPSHIAPTKEQMEKHPALKQAWEEYMIVRKLLGV